MKFTKWISTIEKLTRPFPRGDGTWKSRLDQMHHALLDANDERSLVIRQLLAEDQVTHQVIDMEMCWDWWRRPRFKVCDGMVSCMQHCSIDIPSDALKVPFPAFEICLPKDSFPSSFLIGFNLISSFYQTY